MKAQLSSYGAKFAQFLGNNAVDLAAGAVTIGAGVAVAKAGTAAVTTACLVGGGIAAAFVTFHATKGVIMAGMLAPSAIKGMYAYAKEAMNKPEATRVQVAA